MKRQMERQNPGLAGPEVSALGPREGRVSVLGQVNKPTLLELTPDRRMTILEAIAAAGGLTGRANDSKIDVTRRGVKTPLRFRLDDLRMTTDPEEVFYLEAGDVIFVPERVL